MLYQDHEQTNDTGAAEHTSHADPQPPQPAQVPATAAAKSVVPPTGRPQQQQQQQQPQQRHAPAAHLITTPLSVPPKVVAARLAVAHDEPVLVGRVVSAESSAVRGTPGQPQQPPAGDDDTDNSGDADDARSDTSASSSAAASSNSFVGDVDKTELIFSFGRYVGQVDPLTGLRDGEGCLHYRSGNVYTGHWRDGAADGFGEKRYKNGDIYRGNWSQGKRSGRGAYLFAQGHFYDGMYVNDEPEGYGIYKTLKGDRFAGHWKAGKKNGKGRETLVSGQVFVGNWRNGLKQGRGKLYLPGAEGYIYGIWNNDKFFRELTENEMGADGKEDVVDEFGLPRDASAPPVTAPWMKPAPLGAAVTDRVLMGVTALEDRMESLGKALERVMGVSNPDGVADRAHGAPPAAATATSAPQLRFASPNRQTADGILASDVDDGEEGEESAPTVGVELRRPPIAAEATPPAATLSTAVGEEDENEEEEEEQERPVAAAARASAAAAAAGPAVAEK